MNQVVKHQNNGNCPKCKELFEKYPGFNKQVRGWFVTFQAKHPEAHISCAGRGFKDQQAAKASKASRADYGESAHNWNAAIDLFVQLSGKDIYDKTWFNNVLAPEIPYFLNWYGAVGSVFKELPHIEFRDWKGLKTQGLLALVESPPFPGDVA